MDVREILSGERLPEILEMFRDAFERKLFSIGNTNVTLLSIIEFFLAIVIFFFLSRLIRGFFRRRILSHSKLADSVQFTILRLTHYLIMIIGILFALNLVGIQLTSLTVGVGVLGVGIAFGLQNITSNFVSGLIILFERHVKVGDYVSVGSIVGQVRSINMRSTTIVTIDNIVLVVPNSRFIEDTVTNWSLGDPKIRISIPVGVAYGSDTELVTRLLLKAAEEHKDVLSEPKPKVLFKGFGDSALNFDLLVWIPEPMLRFTVSSDLYYTIDALFRENNVTVPFPQRDVHIFEGK